MDLLATSGGRLALIAALLAATSLALLLARRRDGVFRTTAPAPRAGRTTAPARRAVVTAADLGRPLGARATLLQLSAPTCATCPQVARVLAALADERPGLAHVEVDVTDAPGLVRRLGVLRTPTVLLLGPDGAVLARSSGAVDRAAVVAALDDTLRPGREVRPAPDAEEVVLSA